METESILPLPRTHIIGSTQRVLVGWITDLNDFYLHPELFREKLTSLDEELLLTYNQSQKPEDNTPLTVGDYCACPSEDESWYRGEICQIEPNNLATVFFIDYGNIQRIQITYLRKLQKKFYGLHRLAFRCSLSNLTKPIDGWPPNIVNEFRDRLNTTFLFCKVVSYNEVRDIFEVELCEKGATKPINKDFEQFQMFHQKQQQQDDRQKSQLQARVGSSFCNTMPIHKFIPMDILDKTYLHQVHILYYINPCQFYVYLPLKVHEYAEFQIKLQEVMKNLQESFPQTSHVAINQLYQPVVAQDNHRIWHRAIVIDAETSPTDICIYFVDVGQQQYVSRENIRPLPNDLSQQPAFAIPCRLFDICPLNGTDRSQWSLDDPLHEEFNQLMSHSANAKIRTVQDKICYEIDIEIPKLGDLATYLVAKNLASRISMRSQQQSSFAGTGLSSQTVSSIQQQLPPATSYFSRTLSQTFDQSRQTQQQPPPQSSQQRNIEVAHQQDRWPQQQMQNFNIAIEFYACSERRSKELEAFSFELEQIYNSQNVDFSLNMSLYLEGTVCAIQHGSHFERVVIKRREGESRVLVQCFDRGEELVVDTSELLAIAEPYSSVPQFAQPFRLRGYDESKVNVNLTRKLKKMILNQRVNIVKYPPMINNFYPVEVTLQDSQSVNQLLLSSDPLPSPRIPMQPGVQQQQSTDYDLLPPNATVPVLGNPQNYTGHEFSNEEQLERIVDVIASPSSCDEYYERTAKWSDDHYQPYHWQRQQQQQADKTAQQPGINRENDNSTPMSTTGQRQLGRFNAGPTSRNEQNQVQTQQSIKLDELNCLPQQLNSAQQKPPHWSITRDKSNNPSTIPSAVSTQTFQNRTVYNQHDAGQQSALFSNARNQVNNVISTKTNEDEKWDVDTRTSRSGLRNETTTQRDGGQSGFKNSFNSRNNNDERQHESGRGSFGNRGGFDRGDRGQSGFNDRSSRGGFQNRYNRDGDGNEGESTSVDTYRGSRGRLNSSDRGNRGSYNSSRSWNDDSGNKEADGGDEGGNNRHGGFTSRGRQNSFESRSRGSGDNESEFTGIGFRNTRGFNNGDRGYRGGRGSYENREGRGGFSDRGNFGGRGSRDFERRGRGGGGNTWQNQKDGEGGQTRFSGWKQKPSSDDSTTVKATNWDDECTERFEVGERFDDYILPTTEIKFVISHIDTPIQFFIQMLEKSEEISQLSDALQKEFKDAPLVNAMSLKAGQVCLSKHTDSCWYRALVLSINGNKARVRYIDFGNCNDVDTKSIRQLAKKRTSPAPFAYPCLLKDTQAEKNVDLNIIISKVDGKEFPGTIESRLNENFILVCENLTNLLENLKLI
ncbi:unnamed protein product, partial [Didymodactylos carnosus]